jgi:hypothetical protein
MPSSALHGFPAGSLRGITTSFNYLENFFGDVSVGGGGFITIL